MALSSPQKKVIIFVSAAILAGLSVKLYRMTSVGRDPAVRMEKERSVHQKQADITVYIGGEVNHPGYYRLPKGSGMDDLVGLAGGLTGNADLGGEVKDLKAGDSFIIGKKTMAKKIEDYIEKRKNRTGAARERYAKYVKKIDLNRAGYEDLISIPGIGAKTAHGILAYRQKKGRFKSREELLRVASIGSEIYETVKDFVYVREE